MRKMVMDSTSIRVGIKFQLLIEGRPFHAEIIHREKKKWRGKIWWRTRIKGEDGSFIMKTHTDELARRITEEGIFVDDQPIQ